MKKVLAIILCVCIALTISVTAFAASSPQNKVIVRKAVATKQDGTIIAVDTPVDVADDNTVTAVADEKTYGKFDGWKIYIVDETTGEVTEKEAVVNVDYKLVKGDANSQEITIIPINKIAIAGNYAGKTTDPTKSSNIDTNVMVRKGFGAREDGTTFDSDKFVEIAVNGVLTATADEKTYGKFNSWSVYVVGDKTVAAKEGTDYSIASGSLKSKEVKVKVLTTKKIIICGNYAGTITDPDKGSAEKGSPKTGDLNVIYVALVLLAAAAVVFGAKRQLSK